MSNIFLEILNEQETLPIPEEVIRLLMASILRDAGITTGKVSVVLVDNATIHDLNREFLRHDYPTDVISFSIEEDVERGMLEGEIVVSTEMAAERAAEFQWQPEQEMLLYIVHGLLHLVGYDDTDDTSREVMRSKEREYLATIGISVPETDSDEEPEQNDDTGSGAFDQAERN